MFPTTIATTDVGRRRHLRRVPTARSSPSPKTTDCCVQSSDCCATALQFTTRYRAPHAACLPQFHFRIFRRRYSLAFDNNIIIVAITTMFEIYSSDTEEEPRLDLSVYYGRQRFCEYDLSPIISQYGIVFIIIV